MELAALSAELQRMDSTVAESIQMLQTSVLELDHQLQEASWFQGCISVCCGSQSKDVAEAQLKGPHVLQRLHCATVATGHASQGLLSCCKIQHDMISVLSKMHRNYCMGSLGFVCFQDCRSLACNWSS